MMVLPDTRLRSAVPYLKRGGRVIDVGTDHAYLPIYLIEADICRSVLACDINRGPIESAQMNIRAAGLTDRIATMQTDGLHGTESFAPDDVMIFGMGGELIVRILSEAPWLCRNETGLILQPMSRAQVLRRWLLENGFAITGETLTLEGKYYQTIAARFAPGQRGKGCDYSEEELLLGRCNLADRSPLLKGFVQHELRVHESVLRGKSLSSTADCSEEERIVAFLKKRLETLR